MYLHFQNWTLPFVMQQLDRKGVRHGDWVIKIFATDQNPRGKFRKNTLHLDVILPESLECLRQVVDFYNPEKILSVREAFLLNKERKSRGKEQE